MRVYSYLFILLSLLILGCDRNPGLPSDGQSQDDFMPAGFAVALTQQEFDALSAEKKYQVGDKLYSTLYKGLGVNEFFDLSRGMSSLTVKQTGFIDQARISLKTALSKTARDAIDDIIDGKDENNNPNPNVAKYTFDEDRPRQLPLARIHEYPLSRDGFVEWMAYFLVNTIMFSPALEMESTGIGDVQNTFRTLANNISERMNVRQIIRGHLSTVARWRVSRSPENHALEAFELYLGLFKTEEDSRKGGIACKEWFLTDGDDGYQLVRTDDVNDEPQVILSDYFVTSCANLYDIVAGHPLLMPRVTEVIVNYLMADRSSEDRLQMVQSIVASGAQTFEDIFKGILFSKEYLLNTERVRGFEESMLPLLGKFRWNPSDPGMNGDINRSVFSNLSSRRREFSQMFMGQMGWNSMSLKIGRTQDVPTDALSFANYHKALRERVLMERDAYQHNLLYENINNSQTVAANFQQMTPDGFLDFIFLTSLQRRTTADEKTDLINLFSPVSGGLSWLQNNAQTNTLVIRADRYDDIMLVTLDYISRLPEFYYFKTVN